MYVYFVMGSHDAIAMVMGPTKFTFLEIFGPNLDIPLAPTTTAIISNVNNYPVLD